MRSWARFPLVFLALTLIGFLSPGPSQPASAAAALPSDTITVTNDGSAQTNYPLQIGRAFIQGEIAHYPQMLVNGRPIQTQADIKNRFPDGSVKFAVISALIPSVPSSGTTSLSFRDQPSGNNVPLEASQMLAASYDFDAQIKLTQAGVTQSANARKMLEDGNYSVWAAGPVATTIILQDSSAARKYDLGFDSFRSIHPVFVATFWPTINKVSVRVVGMNTNTEALEDVTADLAIAIGNAAPKTEYAKANLTTYLATVWSKSLWLGGAPERRINIDHNVAYLTATKFVPNVDPALKSSFGQATIGAQYANWLKRPKDLYERGLWQPGMGSPGARPDIGLHPAWMVQWLYTGDWRHREVALGQADLAGAWRIQLTEGNPAEKFDRAQTKPAIGLPVSIHAHPLERVFDRMTKIKLRARPGRIPWSWQAAHQPDPFSIPYMLTGDWWYLFELQMWAATDALSRASNEDASKVPAYSSILRTAVPVIAGVSGELRGMAWTLRNRARAGFLSPDGSLEQAYFNDITSDMIAVWEGMRGIPLSIPSKTAAWTYGNTKVMHARDAPLAFPLNFFYPLSVADHVLTRDSAQALFKNGGTDLAAQFQMAFMTGVLGELEEKGYPSSALLDFCAKFYTRPFDEGAVAGSDKSKIIGFYVFPLRSGGPIGTGHGGVGPYFTNLDQVMAEFKPDQLATTLANFDSMSGDFSILAYAASTFITKRPNGDKVHAFLKSAVHDKPRATTNFYIGGETGFDLLPRAPDDAPLPPPVSTPVMPSLQAPSTP